MGEEDKGGGRHNMTFGRFRRELAQRARASPRKKNSAPSRRLIISSLLFRSRRCHDDG